MLAARLDRDPGADLFAQVAAHELHLALDQVHWFSHWVTDRDMPKRFDTRFVAVAAPPGQQAEADLGEAVELMWLTPQAALQPVRTAAGSVYSCVRLCASRKILLHKNRLICKYRQRKLAGSLGGLERELHNLH